MSAPRTGLRATWALVALLALLVTTTSCSDDGGAGGGDATSSTVAEAGDAPALPRLSAEPDPAGVGRIVDADGREVRLRGVNVNALAEYWQGRPDMPTVFPVGADDPTMIAGQGWDVVRLLLSWSRVEPEPGRYDDQYLGEAALLVDRLGALGVYTVIDLHQDAWGPTLAAPDGTTCAEGERPALGWDGAPGWATLDGGASRCAPGGTRELSPAVMASWEAFFTDAPGPGGVGIRQRYVDMLAHVAGAFAERDQVAGIDLMNEPGAFSDDQVVALSAMYEDAAAAMRAAEQEAGAEPHLLLFEPPAIWSAVGSGPPPPFAHDDDVVYAPHIYTGGFTDGDITDDAFATAAEEAKGLGGVPVFSGEWGTGPQRAGADGDGYFIAHQELQDDYGFSATLWTWRESCGDPHKIDAYRDGEVPTVWGLFEVDCQTNEVEGTRSELAAELRWGTIRAAPGRLADTAWDPATGQLTGTGEDAVPGTELEAWVPCADAEGVAVTRDDGLAQMRVATRTPGGCRITARATDESWALTVTATP